MPCKKPSFIWVSISLFCSWVHLFYFHIHLHIRTPCINIPTHILANTFVNFKYVIKFILVYFIHPILTLYLSHSLPFGTHCDYSLPCGSSSYLPHVFIPPLSWLSSLPFRPLLQFTSGYMTYSIPFPFWYHPPKPVYVLTRLFVFLSTPRAHV